MRLQDKVVIVTGGANGIGKATVLRFAAEGAKVMACDLDEQGLATLKTEVEGKGGVCETKIVNVAKKEDVDALVKQTKDTFGKIDILINNAGITRDNLLIRMKEEEWDAVINVNLKGVFLVGQAVAQVMMRQKSGTIINTSSVAGVYGNFGQTNYSATKAGLIGITKTWAKELGKRNITCNAVAPGFIQTEMTASLPEEVITMGKERTPLGRLGTVEDVVNTYLFLASDESNFINGQVIGIDGGLTL